MSILCIKVQITMLNANNYFRKILCVSMTQQPHRDPKHSRTTTPCFRNGHAGVHGGFSYGL